MKAYVASITGPYQGRKQYFLRRGFYQRGPEGASGISPEVEGGTKAGLGFSGLVLDEPWQSNPEKEACTTDAFSYRWQEDFFFLNFVCSGDETWVLCI